MKAFFCIAPGWIGPTRYLFSIVKNYLKIAAILEAAGGDTAFIVPDRTMLDQSREVYTRETWAEGLPSADMLFIWNGQQAEDLKCVEVARKQGTHIVFSELGWLPQRNTLYFDGSGVGPNMSLAKGDLPALTKDRRIELALWLSRYHKLMMPAEPFTNVTKEGFVFAPLQVEEDSNIVKFAPQYGDMQNFIDLVGTYITKPVIFKTHPKAKKKAKDYKAPPDCAIVDEIDLHGTLRTADYVVTINSTVGVEALSYFKHVITVGATFYKGRHITLGADTPEQLHAAIDVAESRRPNKEVIESFLYALKQKQWHQSELDNPYKVSRMFEEFGVLA